jgi:hypothetical protein
MKGFIATLLIVSLSAFRGNACCSDAKMHWRKSHETVVGRVRHADYVESNICFGAISNIEKKGAWYHIYNEKGKKIKSLSNAIGKLEGFSSTFFIISKGAWYYLYNENGKRYKTLSSSTGEIISVSGDTFVVRKGSWIHTYNKNGKKIGSRTAS